MIEVDVGYDTRGIIGPCVMIYTYRNNRATETPRPGIAPGVGAFPVLSLLATLHTAAYCFTLAADTPGSNHDEEAQTS